MVIEFSLVSNCLGWQFSLRLSFPSLDPSTRDNLLLYKKKDVFLDSELSRFQSMVTWPSGGTASQSRVYSRVGLFTQKQGRGLEFQHPLQGYVPLVTLIYPTGPFLLTVLCVRALWASW